MLTTLRRNVIELLAPARDAECARAAIDHGADVVYIGAPAFSARKQAPNTLEDIASVVQYAHTYGVRVYVALNTLLSDDEVEQAISMAHDLYRIGVDALIVQDTALLGPDMPPIALHASTQMSNHTADKVLFWQQLGMEQVVLDRELTLDEIRAIAQKTQVRLEFFVHGALCVSYSGRCYMSQSLCGRSANRGDCCQPCRQPYTLKDKDGHIVQKDRYLLSLRDNNQTDNIEALIDAGVSALKIEGRLKGPDYVANVVMHYRQRIDAILARRKDLKRASAGHVIAGFEPDPSMSFNRGFTSYFVHGRQNDIWQPYTPKSLGEYIGKAEGVRGNTFAVRTERKLNNGDGLCYITDDGRTDGLKVNRAENGQPTRVFPLKINGLVNGARLYRNSNVAFQQMIKNDPTRRIVDLTVEVSADAQGVFCVTMRDEENIVSTTRKQLNVSVAQNAEASAAQMTRQMQKMGQTPYEAQRVVVDASASAWFAPAAELNALRREAVDNHTLKRQEAHKAQPCPIEQNNVPYVVRELGREGNVMNERAKAFYAQHGTVVNEWAYERQTDYHGCTVMTTRHCILHQLGMCLKRNPKNRQLLPMHLEHGRDVYELAFNCGQCEMVVIKK